MVWDALYAKAKVLASVQRACVGKDEDLSSEDILKRLFLHVGGACKQVKSPSPIFIATSDKPVSDASFLDTL